MYGVWYGPRTSSRFCLVSFRPRSRSISRNISCPRANSPASTSSRLSRSASRRLLAIVCANQIQVSSTPQPVVKLVKMQIALLTLCATFLIYPTCTFNLQRSSAYVAIIGALRWRGCAVHVALRGTLRLVTEAMSRDSTVGGSKKHTMRNEFSFKSVVSRTCRHNSRKYRRVPASVELLSPNSRDCGTRTRSSGLQHEFERLL